MLRNVFDARSSRIQDRPSGRCAGPHLGTWKPHGGGTLAGPSVPETICPWVGLVGAGGMYDGSVPQMERVSHLQDGCPHTWKLQGVGYNGNMIWCHAIYPVLTSLLTASSLS